MSDTEYTPTRSEIERAWAMRRFQLDEEAGRETDGLRYAAETRRAFKKFEAAIRRDQIEKVQEELVRRDQFSERTLRILDEMAEKIGDTNEQ